MAALPRFGSSAGSGHSTRLSQRCMGWNRKLSLVLFLVAVAAAGYLLRSLVPTMIDEYEKAAAVQPGLGLRLPGRGRRRRGWRF